MPTRVNINGVYRRVWPSRVSIDGVWRPDDSYGMINGVWRKTHEHHISPGNIIGFRIIYVRDPSARSDQYPHLKSTKKLPVRVLLSGDTRGNMDFVKKGIAFEYERDMPNSEGICLYRGTMYAVFTDGTTLPVNPRISPNLWDLPDLYETSIQIYGYEFYESYGFYMSGWNSIFHKSQFIKSENFENEGQVKRYNLLNNYNILPNTSRDENFSLEISIGIARDLHTEKYNMVGSYGVLDHSYESILVNGEEKPFVVEAYH